MASKSRSIIAIIILALVLIGGGILIGINTISNPVNINPSSQKQTDETKELLEFKKAAKDIFDVELESSDIKKCSEDLFNQGYYLCFSDKDLNGYKKVPFRYVICQDKVVVTEPLNHYFYELGIKSNDVITSINSKSVTEYSFNEINELFTNKNQESVLVTIERKDSSIDKTIDFSHQNESVTAKVEKDTKNDTVKITVYDIDKTPASYAYEQASGYKKVIIDLSECVANEPGSIASYMSLFCGSLGEELLINESGYIYRSNRNTKIVFDSVLGSKESLCIEFLCSRLLVARSSLIMKCRYYKTYDNYTYGVVANSGLLSLAIGK